MLKPVLLGFAAFLATGGGIAIAQDMGPPPGGRAMIRADANGDGVITREEFVAQATQRFDRMDVNHDGKVDQAEMQQVGERMRNMRGMGGDMPPPPAPPAPPKR